MRADSLPRIASRYGFYSLLVVVALTASGCKTDTGPDDPTVLGDPPSEAYLGVEYYYNFGAYGGEDLLDFSLTNAPSWLGLEGTSNKARPGIIMRGVPGLSGGGRGDADLGQSENINLLTTDGSSAGVLSFDIEVERNPLSLDADDFAEGKASDDPESGDNRCEAPTLNAEGEHTYEANEFAEDGTVSGTETRTSQTTPVLVKVLLEQPSVTRIAVAFELSSDFDPNGCDQGFTPEHQRCEEGDSNRDDAIIGRDIVAFGSNSEQWLGVPDYLEYQEDEDGVVSQGVVTLEPGITECYIRLEVVDDTIPEPSESLRITLTEIRSGLAALGPSDTEVRATLVIDDNEPVVRLETLEGRQRDAVSVGEAREFVAVLSGDRGRQTILARLADGEDSVAKEGDYVIETPVGEDNWEENSTLAFPEGTNRVRFRVAIPDDYTNPELDDRFLLLEPDQQFQAGRENYAGTAADGDLRVNINELVTPLVLNDGDGFVATDISLGHEGRLFVAGYDGQANDQVLVRIFDQKGNLLQEVAVSDSAVELQNPDPVIDFVQREETEGSNRVDRFEFAVAYTATEEIPDQTSNGGEDVVAGLYWFDEAQPAGNEYVEVWTLRTGTSGDDIPRWVGVNSDSGAVIVAGETSGSWPGTTRGGESDSFLQRIDTTRDANDRVPEIAWTRQVGSSENDSVVSGSTSSASPYLFGRTTGAIGGNAQLGGDDAFFYNASSADSTLTVYQRGTDSDETVTDGLFAFSNIWLLGNSNQRYSVGRKDDEDNTLESDSLTHKSGFLLGYSFSGKINKAFSFGSDDRNHPDTFTSLLAFDDGLVAGGWSQGAFAQASENSGTTQPVLGRLDPAKNIEAEDDEDGESREIEIVSELWRVQADMGGAEIRALANYRDDEIVTLVRDEVGGNEEWTILLFSAEGSQLN
ncbi:hypothetical protein [Marinobacter sp.]|uniref:hypothetical protein n=1 Tax=Marinobacter sp. TaxID=50741 RepID=UPI0034A34A09